MDPMSSNTLQEGIKDEISLAVDLNPERELRRLSISSEVPGNGQAYTMLPAECFEDAMLEEDLEAIPEKKAKIDQEQPVVHQKSSGEGKRIESRFNHGFLKKPDNPRSAKDLFEHSYVRRFGDLTKEEKSGIASEEWKKISEDEQKKWKDKAKKEAEAHDIAMANYRLVIKDDPWRTTCPKGRLPHSEVDDGTGVKHYRGVASWTPSGTDGKDVVLRYPMAFGYFKCPVCFEKDRLFETHHNMVSHARQKHQSVILECNCSKRFSSIELLKEHIDRGCNAKEVPATTSVPKPKEKECKMKAPFEYWWRSVKEPFTEINKGLTPKEMIKAAWKAWQDVDQEIWKIMADNQVPTELKRKKAYARKGGVRVNPEVEHLVNNPEEEVAEVEHIVHNPD